MSLNPERWTLKTQEALASAVQRARDSSNAEVTPEHLLAAVLDQDQFALQDVDEFILVGMPVPLA